MALFREIKKKLRYS